MVKKDLLNILGALLQTVIIVQALERNETYYKQLLDKLYETESRIRPGYIYGKPTIVKIDFFVQTFGPLDEVEMDFNADLDFRQTWVDERLSYEAEDDTPVYISPQDINKFWKPDIYFPNDKSGTFHVVSIPNKSLRIYRNGTIRYLSRMSIKVSCTMDLSTFPLDSQKCEIKISTYSYDNYEIDLQWYDENPIEIKPDELNLPQFHLQKAWHDTCQEQYKTGSYSCLSAKFCLTRHVGFFILQNYIPSMLVVFISWISFWINKKSEPARITLSVTTVLTMATQLSSSRSASMKVPYLKAIDVWYTSCMIFVFAALIEYAFVNVGLRSKLNDEEFDSTNTDTLNNRRRTIKEKVTSQARKIKSGWKSKTIDQYSRIGFPIAFLVFNFIYWITYSVLSYGKQYDCYKK